MPSAPRYMESLLREALNDLHRGVAGDEAGTTMMLFIVTWIPRRLLLHLKKLGEPVRLVQSPQAWGFARVQSCMVPGSNKPASRFSRSRAPFPEYSLECSFTQALLRFILY